MGEAATGSLWHVTEFSRHPRILVPCASLAKISCCVP